MRNKKLSKLSWYVNRLISMGPGEIIYRLSSQVTIWQERSAVRKPNHDYHPYPLPADLFPSFKKAGWSNFILDSQQTTLREQIKERYGAGVQATMAEAELLLQNKISLFGRTLELDNPVQWSKDPLTKKSWPDTFWAGIDVRDGETVGGIKWARELNRHHHFVTLGKAYWLSEDERFAEALATQFESWLDANPPFMGIGWSSALSNAIRAINWIWALQFVHQSPAMTEALFGRIISALAAQTNFIGRHLSKFSSANNHLIGEAAGLAYVGLSLPWLKGAKGWREQGMRILTAEIEKQIYPDGVPAEQAFNYLAFDLDFYLLVWLAALKQGTNIPAIWSERFGAACAFLGAVMDGKGRVPAIGDSDDGRVLALDERPDRNDYLSILASAAVLLEQPEFKAIAGEWDEKSHWLMGQSGRERFEKLETQPLSNSSKLFKAGGYGLMHQGNTSLLLDFGPLGYLSLAAHGHADALSLLLTAEEQPILIDAGTYAYREGGQWRRYFRGTPAHNTIVIDGQEQSEMRGDFLWGQRAAARLLDWHTNDEFDLCSAEHDGYANLGLTHRRTVLFAKPDWILVEDYLSGEGSHQIDQNWHFPIGTQVQQTAETINISVNKTAVQILTDSKPGLATHVVEGQSSPIQGWVSTHYGHKAPAPVLVVSGQCMFPLRLLTLINLGEPKETAELAAQRDTLQGMISSL